MSKNLADNIVALRKKHGLSQEQFAEKIGVTRQAVSNWERRIATPDVETLDLIANPQSDQPLKVGRFCFAHF